MKRVLAGFALMGVVAFAGCNQGSPGGPGATEPTTNRQAVLQNDDTFNLSAPITSTVIKQGEKRSVSIGLKRGKNFDEEVGLKFDAMPKGVTLDPSSPMIKHGDTEAKMMLNAKADAALGDFTIKVTGHPTKGADATINFKVTVEKK